MKTTKQKLSYLIPVVLCALTVVYSVYTDHKPASSDYLGIDMSMDMGKYVIFDENAIQNLFNKKVSGTQFDFGV